MDEALDILPGLPLASSRSLTLCDSGSRSPARRSWPTSCGWSRGRRVHTNHFLHPDFTAATS